MLYKEWVSWVNSLVPILRLLRVLYMFSSDLLLLVRQSKHQKHQAFEAELHANADRIRGVIDMGNSLIDRGACAGSEDAVKVSSSKRIFGNCEWLSKLNDPLTKTVLPPVNLV